MKHTMEDFDELEELELAEQMDQLRALESEPPRLERDDSAEDSEDRDAPPRLERTTLGESRDAFNRRKALERADNSIQRNNRAKEYADQLKKDEEKKEAYRKSLYG